MLPGTELRPVSFNKRQQNEEAFFEKNLWCAHVAPMLKKWETLFTVSVFVSKIQVILRYTAGNFNENSSMRAVAKILEHEQASTHLILVSNLSKGQILRALSNWMGPGSRYPHLQIASSCYA